LLPNIFYLFDKFLFLRSRDVPPALPPLSSRGSGTLSPVESLAEITTAVPEHQQQQQQRAVVVEVNSLVDFPALRPQDNSNSTSPPAAAGQGSSGSCVDIRIRLFCFCADLDPAFHFNADPDPAFTLMRIWILLLPGLYCERSRPSTYGSILSL
jgi:hypothetical protein